MISDSGLLFGHAVYSSEENNIQTFTVIYSCFIAIHVCDGKICFPTYKGLLYRPVAKNWKYITESSLVNETQVIQ